MECFSIRFPDTPAGKKACDRLCYCLDGYKYKVNKKQYYENYGFDTYTRVSIDVPYKGRQRFIARNRVRLFYLGMQLVKISPVKELV